MVGGVVGYGEELTDRGDVRLPACPVESFGDVEDDIGTEQREPGREPAVGLEAMDLPYGAERPLHRIDGCGLIPLSVQVGLVEVGAKASTRRFVGWRGFGDRPGWVSRRRGFEIKGESDPNCQRLPLQRPSSRDEPDVHVSKRNRKSLMAH